MIKFEKREPTQRSKPKGAPRKYDFQNLKPGWTMVITADEPGAQRKRYGKTVRSKIQGSAYAYGKKNNLRIGVNNLENGDVEIFLK